MGIIQIMAGVFCVAALLVTGLQLSLALGAPWGEMAMGGARRGRFPPSLRIAALLQMLLVWLATLIVLTRAGLILPAHADSAARAIWAVVALFAVSLVLNSITSSRKERLFGVPVTAAMLGSSTFLALS